MKKKLNPIETKIITVLVQNEGSMTTSQIAEAAKISWNTALIYLNNFYEMKWVDKTESGSTIYWTAIVEE